MDHFPSQEIDRRLSLYRGLHNSFDMWLVLGVTDLNVIFDWRLQAENKMIAAGRPGLTNDQVRSDMV